jgi:anaerobic magnesium-protoporphyrin IX monomethyl ester cyclase
VKVCLVRCPSPFLVDEYCLPPLGLMAVGTALKVAGHEVTIHDGPMDQLPMGFTHYGFGPTIAEYSSALSMKRRIEEDNPAARIVIGGPHATVNLEVCVNDGFDCVVHGDGEFIAEKAFFGKDRVLYSEEHPLDDYPTIDRSLLDIHKYKFLVDGRFATTMMTSQGCPYKCAFCSKNYPTVRFRSPESVRAEIKYLRDDFGFTAIAFPEDLFILDKKRTEIICGHLKDMGMYWRCLVRADTVVRHGEAFIRMMADSGCRAVGMGIESGSDKILSIVNKGEKADTLRAGVRILKNAGLAVKGFFILGLPGESPETLEETRRFLTEEKLDDVDIKIYQPYPGTPIWRDRQKYDIDWSAPSDYGSMFYKGRAGDYRGSVRTSSLSTEQIYDAWVGMEREFKKYA